MDEIDVAIKTCKPDASNEDKVKFLEEAGEWPNTNGKLNPYYSEPLMEDVHTHIHTHARRYRSCVNIDLWCKYVF